MADVNVDINLESGPGVDARLFFPGSASVEVSSATINDTTSSAVLFFSDRKTGLKYELDYTGSNFNFGNLGADIEGEITGVTLYGYDTSGNKVQLGAMSITDQAGNPTSIEMTSAANFTQNTPQNVAQTGTVQLSQTGDTGADKLYGSVYNDILSGYGGHDTLTGGDGNDRFEFISSGATTYDFVTDFTRGHDKLDLDASLGNFKGLHNSTLANVFHDITNSAETDSDRLIYNHNTGALFYDKDGAGGKAPTEIAVLTNHAHINYSDIKIIG